MCRVYQNQAAAAYLSLYFFIYLSLKQTVGAYSFFYCFIFLSLHYQTLTIFVTLFSGTVRPRKLKLGTHVDNGCMYRAYRNWAAYLSLYWSIFLSLQFLVLNLSFSSDNSIAGLADPLTALVCTCLQTVLVYFEAEFDSNYHILHNGKADLWQ